MRKSPALLLACAALLAACSSSSDSAGSSPAPTPSADSRGGIPPGYPIDVDVVAPLVITTIGPDPIPVTGTDGKVHVAYELSVLNSGPRPATITKLETLADGPAGAAVATIGQQEAVERTLLIPNLSPVPVTEIPAGRTAVLVLDGVYDTRAKVPADVTHRLSVTLGKALPEYQPVSARYPDSVIQIGGAVRTSAASPVVIGPPLAGDDWVAGNACCVVSPHRGAVMGVGGRLNGSERYAIDWLRVDPAKSPASTHRGDGTRNEDYLAYDAPLLAVADGTVAAVVSDNKEATPQVITPDQSFEELGGNYVIIDIGDGNFAFYAHMIPGSASVKVGDKVTRGQVIGRLGNSGNTSEAHLHFHVMRAPVPLSSDNVPFEIDRFTFVGTFNDDRFVSEAKPSARTNQLPLAWDVVDFPPAA
ncbi:MULTISPECIES: M23 family metallopeptidase [unclassified Mycobacterium]|uniref:M23 family metallopeptidase n=1 Tax=unclassified Mycobacterium TaxID=2642494 RepID=UPI0029C95736|nr:MULTISPECIES: M23 family metallopeptidase [unclassified Mycobacterium]